EKGCDIVSGDYIIEFLARELRPDKVIFGTDVEGIYRDPKDPTSLIPRIDERNLSDMRKFLKSTQKIDVTGGMIEKLNSMVRISKLGVLVQVISLLSSGNVYRAIKGEKIGTIVKI
ncbi:MAG: amino acid kinase family protein, partial [Candidatus Njordarchaeales archaeon]